MNRRNKQEQRLVTNYWMVSRCWNNYSLSISQAMSVEKAIKILAEIQYKATSKMLRARATGLVTQIIHFQDDKVQNRKTV